MPEESSEGQELVDTLARMAGNGQSHSQCLSYFEQHTRLGSENPVNFDHVSVVNQNWSKFRLSGLSFCNAQFIGCKLDFADFNGCDLQDATFIEWRSPTPSDGSEVRIRKVVYTTVTQAEFGGTRAERTKFYCTLRDSKFTSAFLDDCDFSKSQLQNVAFIATSLRNANFQGAQLNSATRFNHIDRISGATIDRYSLACLGPDFGGLTEGNRIDMKIVDDVAELRQTFGGLWGMLHIVAMIVFLAPYVRFLAINWTKAKFAGNPEPSMTLLEALLRFIVTGGLNWQHSWMPNPWSLAPFLIYLAYNVARGALLWKTKKLETQQEVSGLPVRFSLADSKGWSACDRIVKWSFRFAMIAVAVNTIHFLQMRIPVDP